MKKKAVLLDSSSAILLEKSDLLSRLIRFYHVTFADAVYRELTENSYKSSSLFQAVCSDGRIAVMKSGDIFRTTSQTNPELEALNPGERETIQLCQGGTGDFILLDDRKAARYCHKNNLPFINALLFPRILKMNGLISETECRRKTTKVTEIGRYSAKIIRIVEELTDKDLFHFFP